MLNETSSAPLGRQYYIIRYGYIKSPVVLVRPDKVIPIVEAIHSFTIGSGFQLDRGFSLGLETSYSKVRLPLDEKNGMGDSRVFFKYDFPKYFADWNFLVLPDITIPTGEKSLFLGNGQSSAGLLTGARYQYSPSFHLVTNIGYKSSKGATFRNINYENLVTFSTGAAKMLTPKTRIVGEIFSSYSFSSTPGPGPGEAYFGIIDSCLNNFIMKNSVAHV